MTMRVAAASLVAASLAVALVSSPAAADPVRVVSGGPSGGDRQSAVDAVARLRGSALAVCWKKATRARVELAVAGSGEVTRARHIGGGAVGQCVAGVLAVQTLPRTRRGYKVVLEIDPAGASGRTASAITEDLVSVRPALQQCFDRAKSARAGQVAIRFVIQPDGRVVDPAIASSDIASKSAESCMTAALAKFRLRAADGAKPVSYTLSMAFQRGGGSAAAVGASGQPVPKKDGPISTAALTKVMSDARPRFAACARKARGKLDGTAVVRFTIGADGTTRNVKIKSSDLKQPAVEACLVAHAKKLAFPAEKGRAKTRVFYPFQFRP